jgi:carbon storage regulator
MLVLSRKVDEAIVIGGDIVVRVLSVSNGRIRLGIDAPDEVLVLRGELADRLQLGPVVVDADPHFATAQG